MLTKKKSRGGDFRLVPFFCVLFASAHRHPSQTTNRPHQFLFVFHLRIALGEDAEQTISEYPELLFHNEEELTKVRDFL